MEHKMLDRDSFLVIGTATRVTQENETSDYYTTIWKEFELRRGEVEPHSVDNAFYGLSFSGMDEGAFEYIAGMAVKDIPLVPRGLVAREVPAARYVVFSCPLTAIGETYRYIFREWLPGSPLSLNVTAPVFEQYPPVGEEASPVLIHVPIVDIP
jgi:predicted transcriptional regulator YdeE